MRTTHAIATAAVTVLQLTCVPLRLRAEIVAPGGSITTNGLDVPLTGEVVATEAQNVTLNYDLGTFEPSTATDATAFDSNGSLSGLAVDDFLVFDPAEQQDTTTALTATFALTGTFQPITDGGGNVIPLPAGAWFGLVALGGGALAAKSRMLRRAF
jgi:hypothetical protein